MKQHKYIVISGGSLSGLGKGVVSASIGKLLTPKNKVITIKCDGYLNVDPGTMNPIEHGEVFVLEDGAEVDMDFGHYERFLNINCKKEWSLTSGKIFQMVIEKEREGGYLGKTVQMIPHVTDMIKERIKKISEQEQADITIIELGGTVGDIEMELFIEATRQLRLEVAKQDMLYIMLTFIPKLAVVGEQKTKPTQQAVKNLQQRGIQPDLIIGRAQEKLDEKTKQKIALFANLREEDIISNPDLETIYELPLIFEEEGLHTLLAQKLQTFNQAVPQKWKKLVKTIKAPKKEITIAIAGKYTELKDSYVSISEALTHCGAYFDTKINLKWIETTDLENEEHINNIPELENCCGIIVPGGFGGRGIEGKIKVIKYAREKNIPFLGICYGLQLAVIEFARNVCGITTAHTTEVQQTNEAVIDILEEQKEITKKGGTMRLGGYEAKLNEGSRISQLYNNTKASERHRHRYEVNPKYHKILEEKGLIISGKSPDGTLAEFIEIPEHKYFVATQGHPELKSRLETPAPLFYGLVGACIKK